jgi:hypothetical protein
VRTHLTFHTIQTTAKTLKSKAEEEVKVEVTTTMVAVLA